VPLPIPQGPNERWSLDFMADQLVDGRVFRTLKVVDDFTRECRAIEVDTSLSGACGPRPRRAQAYGGSCQASGRSPRPMRPANRPFVALVESSGRYA
jgi:hypothetical protein